MEVSNEGLEIEISSAVTSSKYARLERLAVAEGKTVAEVVSELVAEGLDARYLIDRKPGKVIPFAGLKSTNRGTDT